MKVTDLEHIEIRNKILKGCHLAVRKLIKERKKTRGSLVIMVDGKITHVSAKDL